MIFQRKDLKTTLAMIRKETGAEEFISTTILLMA
jgi:hypothetical protein